MIMLLLNDFVFLHTLSLSDSRPYDIYMYFIIFIWIQSKLLILCSLYFVACAQTTHEGRRGEENPGSGNNNKYSVCQPRDSNAIA